MYKGKNFHIRYSPAKYDDRELYFYPKENIVIYKEWFDPGKNPNKTTYTIDEMKNILIGSPVRGFRHHIGIENSNKLEKVKTYIESLELEN